MTSNNEHACNNNKHAYDNMSFMNPIVHQAGQSQTDGFEVNTESSTAIRFANGHHR